MNPDTLINTLTKIHRAHDALVNGVESLRAAAHQAGHADATADLDAWREHYRHPPVSAVLRAVEGPQHETEPETAAEEAEPPPPPKKVPPPPPPPAGGGIPLQSGSIVAGRQ